MSGDRLAEMVTFQRVVESGSFSAAARQLGLSQPHVSRLIAALESRLGARLVNRTTRRLSLTEQGEVFLLRCRRILSEVDLAEREARDAHAAPQGRIRLNTSAMLAGSLALPALMAFRALHPAIEADLVADDRRIDPVKESYDLILRIGALENSSLMKRFAGHAPLGLFAAPGYLAGRAIAAGPIRDWADLAGMALIGVRNRPWRSDARGADPDSADSARGGWLEVSNALLARDAVIAGAGAAILPVFLTAGQDMIRLDVPPIAPLDVHFLHPFGDHPPRRISLFMDFAVRFWRAAAQLDPRP
jgi:DNA-binding transcriptional LysR family regulator